MIYYLRKRWPHPEYMPARSVTQFCLTTGDPRTAARQVPLPLGLPREEHWSELPFPSLGDLPDPETEPESPASPALAGRFFTTE